MPTREIKSIFFTRFHHEKGSRVLHQVPEGSITPSNSPSAPPSPLIDFDSITTYLIPTQQFCDRLITFCTNHHRVLGYPVCIREGKYSRNEFIFNFSIVIEESREDWTAYGEVVRKLGRLLRGLEEQGGFLSREEDDAGVWEDDAFEGGFYGVSGGEFLTSVGGSKVYALCEMVLEDLNNYAECMIPIDESNTINLKLFPTHPPPPPIRSYHVPLLTISLASLTSPISSDLTLMRVLPFINGINSVIHIAQLADTDLSLTRKAIQHLVYYGCLILLDVFSFGAIYAPTAELGGFILDKSVQEECARYVKVPRMRMGSRSVKMGSESSQTREDRTSITSDSARSDITTLNATDFDTYSSRQDQDDDDDENTISHVDLITLYASLRQGLTLKNFVLENLDLLHDIDIRRFITFGIIKGFLYRVHRYAISTATHSGAPTPYPSAPPTSLQSHPSSEHPSSDVATIRGHTASISNPLQHRSSTVSTTQRPSFASTVNPTAFNDEDVTRLESISSDDRSSLPLMKFLDGMHSFDEICMELGKSERVVEEKIKALGDVQVFWR